MKFSRLIVQFDVFDSINNSVTVYVLPCKDAAEVTVAARHFL